MFYCIMTLLTRLTQVNNNLSNLILTMIWVKLIQERKPVLGLDGRGDEKYALNEELKMVEEKRFIFSLCLICFQNVAKLLVAIRAQM